MTKPIDIAAIDAQLAAITQGEWLNDGRCGCAGIYVGPKVNCFDDVGRFVAYSSQPHDEQSQLDWDFIAAAPRLVQRLRDEVVRLRSEYDEALEVYEEGRQLLRESRDRAVNQERLADEALARAGVAMADRYGATMGIAEGIDVLAADRDRLTAELARRDAERTEAERVWATIKKLGERDGHDAPTLLAALEAAAGETPNGF